MPRPASVIQRYERLLDINRSLASTLDVPNLLRTIVNAAAEITDCESASILLVDPTTNELRFEAATNLDPTETASIVVPKESIAGWIAQHNEVLIIPDVSNDSRFYQAVDQQTTFVTRSILGVPLSHNNQTIGVLEALNKRNNARYSRGDVHLLEVLAANAAVAIINARLFHQSDLMAELVHEIRTPLNALTAATHLLRHPALPPEMHADTVSTMQSELERLTDIASRFLDYARLESGRTQFNFVAVDARQLTQECFKIVAAQASDRQITLHEQLPADYPPLWADRNQFKQVLLNLLTNAIKYNREGGQIFVEGRTVADEVLFIVRDTGPGIPPEALPNLFQRFYRVGRDEHRAQGTGLGLAIIKRIVEGHRGTISVESTLAVGTAFIVSLPRRVE